ncbi:MAG: DNA repair exonuclease [Candidatus Micrarchaeota archaeon]|nr:DNA repair exonuclease [Candidatus Micrarchaeota archaeon]
MKIAIVSDMHIGYERFSDDAIRQATAAMELANKVADAVIIPGDVFDKRAPKPDVIAQAINLFREMSERRWNAKVMEFRSATAKSFVDVPIVAISGTHERTAAGKDNALNLLGLAGLLVDTSEATTILEKDGERVAVFGFGGISEERVRDQLRNLDPKPVQGIFSIFMFHQSVYEILPFSDEFIHYEELPKGFDLYVDGHIHSRIEHTVHGKPFLIPGSTVLTQLKDGEQGAKGFYLFDTQKRSYEFVPIESRPFVVKELDFKGASPRELKERCEREIDEISKKHNNPIVRVKLTGTIASGFGSADMPLQELINRYSNSLVLDLDSSKLVDTQVEKGILEVREAKGGGSSVREMGVSMLLSRMKEEGLDSKIRVSDLFTVLSSESKKEKVLAEAMELLEQG